MKNLGPFKTDEEDFKVLLQFTKMMAKRFEASDPAILGILIKLNEKMCLAAQDPRGMASLIIEHDNIIKK